MKKVLFIFLNLIFVFAANAQNKTTKNPLIEKPATSSAVIGNDEPIYKAPDLDVQPEFPGGVGEFIKFVNSKFDKTKLEPGATGNLKTYVSFVVEKDGSLSGLKILRDPGFGSGAEALRVLKLSPKWEAAVKDGKKVRSSYNVPIVGNL